MSRCSVSLVSSTSPWNCMMFLQLPFPVTKFSVSCMCLNAERLNLQFRDVDAVSTISSYCCWYIASGVWKLYGCAPPSSSRRGIFLALGTTGLSKCRSCAAAVVFSQNSWIPSAQRHFMSSLSVSTICVAFCRYNWFFWSAVLTVSMREKFSMSFNEKKVLNFCRCKRTLRTLPPASPLSFKDMSSINSSSTL